MTRTSKWPMGVSRRMWWTACLSVLGYAGRARLRKQLPMARDPQEWRRNLEDLRQRRQRRLAARQP
jgi:hypothetical protein